MTSNSKLKLKEIAQKSRLTSEIRDKFYFLIYLIDKSHKEVRENIANLSDKEQITFYLDAKNKLHMITEHKKEFVKKDYADFIGKRVEITYVKGDESKLLIQRCMLECKPDFIY